MKYIDMENWPRRKHFEFFRGMGQPYFSLCAEVDLSAFYPAVKAGGHSISVAIVYAIARVANAMPAFRYRIRGDQVIEHPVVHPSTTVLTNDDLFSFCTVQYSGNFDTFAERAAEQIANVQADIVLEDEPRQDDLLFMTAIPWVSFTGFMHPIPLNPPDSVPRFAWGKFFTEGDRMKMPLSVQVHHALLDGVHVGRFYERMQAFLDEGF